MAEPRGCGFIGSMESFESSKEDWHNYQRRLEIWMKADKIEDEDKVNVFLAMIGPAAFEVVTNYVSPDDPSEDGVCSTNTDSVQLLHIDKEPDCTQNDFQETTPRAK